MLGVMAVAAVAARTDCCCRTASRCSATSSRSGARGARRSMGMSAQVHDPAMLRPYHQRGRAGVRYHRAVEFAADVSADRRRRWRCCPIRLRRSRFWRSARRSISIAARKLAARRAGADLRGDAAGGAVSSRHGADRAADRRRFRAGAALARQAAAGARARWSALLAIKPHLAMLWPLLLALIGTLARVRGGGGEHAGVRAARRRWCSASTLIVRFFENLGASQDADQRPAHHHAGLCEPLCQSAWAWACRTASGALRCMRSSAVARALGRCAVLRVSLRGERAQRRARRFARRRC